MPSFSLATAQAEIAHILDTYKGPLPTSLAKAYYHPDGDHNRRDDKSQRTRLVDKKQAIIAHQRANRPCR